MNMENIVAGLHPLERAIVPYLHKCKTEKELVKATGLSPVEVVRALQWLDNKGIIKLRKETKEKITLGSNGELALNDGLPEIRFLKAAAKPLKMGEIAKAAKLEGAEVNVSLGLLKRKGCISLEKGEIQITDLGKAYLEKESPEEKLLKKLSSGGLSLEEFEDIDKAGYELLKGRKGMLDKKSSTDFLYELTPDGEKLAKTKIDVSNIIDNLTSEDLKTGAWKGKTIRRYDVAINVPGITGGKRHFVKQATDYAKRIWLEMGFKEMQGGILHTSFWNFDALYTAQDHPVREMQDTFFIEKPAKGKMPEDKVLKAVKEMHEKGGDIGSTGWGGKWTEEEASLNVLRTHTTVLSAQTLAKLKEEDLPAKFFSVGRCFRNETLDWSHLFEFNQTEGIVVDPNATFEHLLGYLQAFFNKMGFEKVRFRPAHFPYTEPSVEIDVYHPVHQTWLELGGAGVFRPEVVVPLLGKDIPVLAWGPGLDRVLCDYYKITDIRDLYKNDIKQIREMKVWNK